MPPSWILCSPCPPNFLSGLLELVGTPISQQLLLTPALLPNTQTCSEKPGSQAMRGSPSDPHPSAAERPGAAALEEREPGASRGGRGVGAPWSWDIPAPAPAAGPQLGKGGASAASFSPSFASSQRPSWASEVSGSRSEGRPARAASPGRSSLMPRRRH